MGVAGTSLLPNFTFLGAQCTDNGNNVTTTVDSNLRKATFTLLQTATTSTRASSTTTRCSKDPSS